MSFIDWLFERTPGEFDAAPNAQGVILGAPAHPDLEEDEDGHVRLALEPVFTIIEYTDSVGATTRRRITMRSLATGPHSPLLRAVCHERGALRTFRCDRISCFLEPDGEVIGTADFFRDVMDVDLKVFVPAADAVDTECARQLRDKLAPALSILVAAARSDDEFHPNEMAAICEYAVNEGRILAHCGLLPAQPSPDDNYRLTAMIRRMRPTADTVEADLRRVLAWEQNRFERLTAALDAVIRADGVETVDEFDFLNDLTALKTQIEGRY